MFFSLRHSRYFRSFNVVLSLFEPRSYTYFGTRNMTSPPMATDINSERNKSCRISIDNEKPIFLQLKAIPKDIEALIIDHDTPSDSDWAALGDHFTSIQNLKLNAGWNEDLNDEKLPLHWPLERLLFSSSCGETFRSPWVLEGRVKHLMLFLTAGLRFEGPTTAELIKANQEAITRGEREKSTITVAKGTPDQREIGITYVPELVQKWMRDRYGKPPIENDAIENNAIENNAIEAQPEPPPLQIQTLEIIENDACDTFTRFILANANRNMENLTTLVLRTASGLDFNQTSPQMFRQILPQMTQLKTLTLTVSEKTFRGWGEGSKNEKEVASDGDGKKEEGKSSATAYGKDGQEAGKKAAVEKIPGTESNCEEQKDSLLTTLYTCFPPNLECLRFRGPASLAASPAWPDWVAAFSSPTFLPDLKTLSFLLDLNVSVDGQKKRLSEGVESESAGRVHGELEQEKAEKEALRKAKRECEKLWDGAKARGVEVQPFKDHWAEEWADYDVDHRWAEL